MNEFMQINQRRTIGTINPFRSNNSKLNAISGGKTKGEHNVIIHKSVNVRINNLIFTKHTNFLL